MGGRASERGKKAKRSLDQDVRLHTDVFTAFFIVRTAKKPAFVEQAEEGFRRAAKNNFVLSTILFKSMTNDREHDETLREERTQSFEGDALEYSPLLNGIYSTSVEFER